MEASLGGHTFVVISHMIFHVKTRTLHISRDSSMRHVASHGAPLTIPP
jgi:hypothetical protein